MSNKYINYVLSITALAVVYMFVSFVGLSLGENPNFTPVWPSTGIAVAVLLLYGYRLWPGILIGALLVGVLVDSSPVSIVTIALGNTIVPLLSVYLLKRLGFDCALTRVKDVVYLVVVAGLLCSVVGAAIGAYSLLASGVISPSALLSTSVSWWIGDVLGVLVITPLILVWVARYRKGFDRKKLRLREMIITDIILVLFNMIVFSKAFESTLEPSMSAYLIFPPLIWIALRFSQLGSVLAVFLVSVVVTLSLRYGLSPIPTGNFNDSMVLLQRFMGITAVTFMVIAAIIEERHLAEKNQRALIKQTVLLDRERAHLRKVNLAKDEFIAVASHQLRTPATGIKIHLGMLRENYAGELPERIKMGVDSAYQFNERQIRIIDDLLGVAQIDMENVVLTKEETDLTPLVNQVIHHFDSTLAERHQTIKFVHDNKQHVSKVDRTKIAMVLENLIDNASKYSPSGKNIQVGLNKVGSRETIEIRDEGVGIAPNDINKLFKKFSRVDNALSVERGGTGLGLYWVKKVIRLHGGRISVSSKLGRGTVFTIKL